MIKIMYSGPGFSLNRDFYSTKHDFHLSSATECMITVWMVSRRNVFNVLDKIGDSAPGTFSFPPLFIQYPRDWIRPCFGMVMHLH